MKRLGVHMDSNSIGWTLFETKDDRVTGVVDGGVRVFPSGRVPKTGEPKAAHRREARSMRRMRDRYLRRRRALMRKAAEAGLMPTDPTEAKKLECLDPYELRTRALDEKVDLTHFGRAVFHLNQGRGFKFNRKTDTGDNEGTAIEEGSKNLDEAMMAESARTLGEFHHIRRSRTVNSGEIPSVRARLVVTGQDDKGKDKTGYEFYPERHHIEDEFEKLWEVQARHHSALTEELREAIHEIIFFQRKLHPVRPGKCPYSDELRIEKAHPLNQRRILYENVNSLRICASGEDDRCLENFQRDAIVRALDEKKPTASIQSMKISLIRLGKLLNLKAGEFLAIDPHGRTSVDCDQVAAVMSHPSRFGPKWFELDVDAQWEIAGGARRAETDEDVSALADRIEKRHDMPRENAMACAGATLPAGYSRAGVTATRNILDRLVEDVISYSQAARDAGLKFTSDRAGVGLGRLPYYGEILDRDVLPGTGEDNHDDIKRHGRLPNPTIHIGLNQLRLLVNAISKRHNVPGEIVVGISPGFTQSGKQKRDAQKRANFSAGAGQIRSERLVELGQPDTGENRELLRLYEELNPKDETERFCPYSGTPITENMLFDGSCVVDYILPYSRTLDASAPNLTLCTRESRQQKIHKTPFEAWGAIPDRWAEIAGRLKLIPENKHWRFQPDAMDRFDIENEFPSSALVDRRYVSRLVTEYLNALYAERRHVRVARGHLTPALRRQWKLNDLLSDRNRNAAHFRNRTDYRHRAIDAAMTACVDPQLVHRIAKEAEGNAHARAEDVVRAIDMPWAGFRGDLGRMLNRIIVSHRPNHGRGDEGPDSTSGALHDGTAYGVVDDDTVVGRMSLTSLKPEHFRSDSVKRIRDRKLMLALAEATKGTQGKDFEIALRRFSREHPDYKGIRRIRITQALSTGARVEIADGRGGVYKAYKANSNQCYVLWRLPNGKFTNTVVTTFSAHNRDKTQANRDKPHPDAKRILTLFKQDMVAIERDGKTGVYYVQALAQSGQVAFVEHFEADAAARARGRTGSFKLLSLTGSSLAKSFVRRVHVDVMGRMRDTGIAKYK